MAPAIASSSTTLRDFVHGFNALLKCARLYGLHHHSSDDQFEKTWKRLKDAIKLSSPRLVIAVSGGVLLLNGEALESSAVELSLAQFLGNAGISSIVFTNDLLQDSFLDFVKVFARGTLKPAQLLQSLKRSFETHPERGIHINEVRFVPAHAASPKSPNWLRDPAELSKLTGMQVAGPRARRFSSFDFGSELVGDFVAEAHLSRPVAEKESRQLIELVTKIGMQNEQEIPDRGEWEVEFDSLPADPKAILCEAVNGLASLGLTYLDDLALVRLSHDIAVRCAAELFESGRLSAKTIRPFLESLCQTVSNHKNSATQKSSDTKASIKAQTEVLERQFWAAISGELKAKVLLSPEIWCVPAKNIQQSLKELQQSSMGETVKEILSQYAMCITSTDPEARKRAAAGVNEISALYTKIGGAPFSQAIRAIGAQLQTERDAETQSLLGAAFVKFSQSAAEQRDFPAVQQMLASLAELEKARPNWTQGLRPRIGFENRIPGFIEQALKSSELETGFVDAMRRAPEGAADYLAARLMKVTHASEREKIVQMAQAIGEPLRVRLREVLELASAPKAVRVTGLLSRLESHVVAQLLRQRIAAGASHRETHDEVLRQLSIAAAPERGQMLTSALDRFDSLIVPMALDEIGMCGDSSLASELLRVANGQRLPDSSEFIRVKAIEALGRLRVLEMEGHLLRFIEEKKGWRCVYPAEMRLAAAQALTKLNPERARVLLSNADLDTKSMSLAPLDARSDHDFVRSRRYQRIRMTRPLPAVVHSTRGKCQPDVQVLSLEGGLLTGNLHLTTGSPASLRISAGLRPIRLDVLVRFARPNQAGVEMVGMDLEDRARLRTLLVSMAPSISKAHRTLLPA